MKRKKKHTFLVSVLSLALCLSIFPSFAQAQDSEIHLTDSADNTENTDFTDPAGDIAEDSASVSEDATVDSTTDLYEDNSKDPVSRIEENTDNKDPSDKEADSEPASFISYSGHVQTYGDLKSVKDGEMLGTTGQSKRIEALVVNKDDAVKDVSGEIMYRVHGQTYGNQKWMKTGEKAGTTGQSKRIEAIQMYLTDDLASKYNIYYAVHCQTFGWSKWVKGSSSDEGWCGTQGLSRRIEAIKIILLPVDSNELPEDLGQFSLISSKQTPSVTYSGHQQTYGDLQAVSNGSKLGVTGEKKRLEALKISLGSTPYSGSISYQVQVQTYGWQDWVEDGSLAGTTGESKRLEAVKIKLTGELSQYYDVWYRVHIQRRGWMGWAKNGQNAGSSNIGYRMESIQIKILPKGSNAPGTNSGYFTNVTPEQGRVNAGLNSVYNKVGKNLKNCFNWCINNIRYVNLSNYVPSGYTNSQWFAIWGLEQHKGDCRALAATFYQLAKGLGYDARYVHGAVFSGNGGTEEHAWVEITIDGTIYVYDVSFQQALKRNGYQFRYGTKGTWRYTNYHYES